MLALLLACAHEPDPPRAVRFNRSGEVPVSATAARELVLVPVIMARDRDWKRLPVTGTATLTFSVPASGPPAVVTLGGASREVLPGAPVTQPVELAWAACEPLRGCYAELPARVTAAADTKLAWSVDLALTDPGPELRVGVDVR